MVRAPLPRGAKEWDEAPTPILVVEILSGSTRRRDQIQKRSLYLDVGVRKYWLVDPERLAITVIRAGETDVVVFDRLGWNPISTTPH